ncbi:CGNR zinc finger domain-containing protein [Nocardiopsis coralliicola]
MNPPAGSPSARSAGQCDRVFADTSRNGTRRFCSTACQNRAKAAAFRARKAGAGG